jgi:hypothetical protein
MSAKTKLWAFLALAAVVVCVGIIFGLTGRTGESPTPAATTNVAQPDTQARAARNSRPKHPVVMGSNSLAEEGVEMDATNADGTVATNWDEKIDEILRADAADKDIAKKLIGLFPQLPADKQIDAVQHISNLLPDEDYPELAKLMNDPKLPEDVLNQLFMDLLNRKSSVLLPELVELAKIPQHPIAGEAKDFLGLYLENDYGTDWNLWSAKVKDYLAANPD